MIADGAGTRQLALREVGLEHFEQARSLLDHARQPPGAIPDINVLDAQLAMYDGRFADAARSYAEVVEQRPDDPLLRCQWAAALMQAGQFDQARRQADYVTRLCREGPPVSSGVRAACLHLQALVALNCGGDFDKAEAAARESRELWRKPDGGPSRAAAAMNNLGALFLLHGDTLGAEGLFNEARDQWSAPAGPRDPHLIAAWDNVAMLRRVLCQQNEAQQAVGRAMTIAQETLPKDSPLLALHLATAAAVARAAGHWTQAQADAEKALLAAEKALGGEHPCVAAILEDLTAIHTAAAHYAEAYRCGSRAGGLIKQLWGADHPYLAMNLDALAKVEIGQGAAALARGKTDAAEEHFSKADALCQEARRIVQQALGPESCWLAEVQYTRGRLEVARHSPAAARAPFEQAQKIWKTILDDQFLPPISQSPPSISVLGDLAALDDNSALIAGAVRQAKRAADLAERVYGSGHPELARLLCILAVLQRQKGDYDDALQSLDKALKIRQAALPPSHPDLAATWEIYASVLRAMTPPQADRAAEMESSAGKSAPPTPWKTG